MKTLSVHYYNSKIPFVLHFFELLHKKSVKMRQKISLRQNTVGLEQHIYASQEKFTHLLVVMVETFRRSEQNFWFLPSGKRN